jgi:saccharopine dehydrogenase-like NADP-dependent oxidoreductase
VAKYCGLEADDDVLNRLEWLGLFSDTPVDASVTCNLDATCKLMMDRQEMQLGEGEQDMVVMKHTFVVEYADRRDTVTSTLVELGVKHGHTAMSRTVSTPVAIAARLLLEGHYTEVGLQRPIEKAVYAPILDELQQRGIMTFHEKVIKSEKL